MRCPVREASQADLGVLNELFAELDRFHRHSLPDLFQEPDGSARSEEFICGIVGGEDSVVFVAELEGQAAGFIHVLIRDAPGIPILRTSRYAVIDALYVLSFRALYLSFRRRPESRPPVVVMRIDPRDKSNGTPT